MQRIDTQPEQSPVLAALIDCDFQLNYNQFLDQLRLANKPLSLASIRFILDSVSLDGEEIKKPEKKKLAWTYRTCRTTKLVVPC